MTLAEFEKDIQQRYGKELSVRINYKGAPDTAGIFFHNLYLGIALSSKGVGRKRGPRYQDTNGVEFRAYGELIDFIKYKLCKHRNGSVS